MNIVPPNIEFHFLICTNARENGNDCASKGSLKLLEELKSWAKTQNFSKKIRINKSGCLDRCAEGVVAVAYPSAEWIVNAGVSDLDSMKKFIQERVK
jgi:(2Fe-2S) ferredoxin